MKLILSAIIILFFSVSYANNFDVSDHIKSANDNFKDRASSSLNKSHELRVNKKERVNKIESLIKSEEYKNRKEFLSYSLATKLGVNKSTTDLKPKYERRSPLPSGHTPILFISSSMPINVLNSYAVDLSKVGGVMILRGTVGGISKLVPTIRLINNLRKYDMTCRDTIENQCERLDITITIDPKRFIKNNVKRVPALIFEKDFNSTPYCESGDPKSSMHIVYGDSSLEGMLQTLYSISDDKNVLFPLQVLQGQTTKRN
ncbi:MAG: type-F conjugative transfer system pilin assembly protein TrbC [Colwellia sp.]|jgi:Type-F conjugative transfer system pilin assembly protein.